MVMLENISTGDRNRRAWLAHCSAALAVLACAATTSALAKALPASASATGITGTKGTKGTTILVVGDSLSAEYGLVRGRGWVALLQERLAQKKIAANVVNASISGDTTSGGKSRLGSLLAQHKPTLVILELGANDALRGLPLDMTRSNLAGMAHAATAIGAKVLVIGMQVPPNYGRQYSDQFVELFGSVAKSEGTALVPFMLKGVADGANATAMFQADRLHPREAAHPIILNNIWPTLERLLPH